MKLVVVTPTLGVSPWLTESVDAVRRHAPHAIHRLVAPAASVGVLADAYPHCDVIAEPPGRRGMYAAINEALSSRNDWMAFSYLNDDDVLRSGFALAFERVKENASTCREAFVYGKVALIDTLGRRLGRIPVSRLPRANRVLYAERLEPVYQHGTIITRSAWERCGGFDEAFRLCGDSEYLARLCVAGVKAVYVPRTVAAFRLRPGQLTKHRAEMQAERARVDEKLGLLQGPGRLERMWARLVFRAANLAVYAGRISRHGFVRFDRVLERGE